MRSTSQGQPNGPSPRFRYWLSPDGSNARIRIEWMTEHGLATNEATLRPDWYLGYQLAWSYGSPPDDIAELARTALHDRLEHGVDGAEFAGWESYVEMSNAVDDVKYDAWWHAQKAVA